MATGFFLFCNMTSPVTAADLATAWEAVRATRPLVQCLVRMDREK